MGAYTPTEDTLYTMYRLTWVLDMFVAVGDTMYVSNRYTVKTPAEWADMVAEAGSDAQLLTNLGLTEDMRDGV